MHSPVHKGDFASNYSLIWFIINGCCLKNILSRHFRAYPQPPPNSAWNKQLAKTYSTDLTKCCENTESRSDMVPVT
jgi:hypothetical protein